MLAVQCDGATVETIEGLSDSGEIADLQAAFEQRNALQCGYCTPGMLTAAQDLLEATAACRAARKSASICRATTAAAPATTPSSMRWRRWRRARAGGKQMKITDNSPPVLTALDRPNSYIGRSVPRPNLQRLTQGRGQYVSDVTLPRMAHVAFVRSPHAHARIVSDRRRRRQESARRDRGGHRRRAGQGDDALGRRAHASQGPEIRAAIPHRRRSRLLAGRGGVRRGRAQRAPRPRTAASWSRSTTRNCRRSPIRRPRSTPRRR